MMVFRPGDRLSVAAGAEGARLMLLGGETLGGPRYIWWNFVASSQGADRGGQGGLARRRLRAWPFPPAAGRRHGVHSGAGLT